MDRIQTGRVRARLQPLVVSEVESETFHVPLGKSLFFTDSLYIRGDSDEKLVVSNFD
jgi:hypothetical protein